MKFMGFLLCIFKDFYFANLNTRVGRIDRPSMNSGTALRLFIPLRCMNAQGPPFDELRDQPGELRITNSESLSVLRVLRGKKTSRSLRGTPHQPPTRILILFNQDIALLLQLIKQVKD
jgi:hypothetical protein